MNINKYFLTLWMGLAPFALSAEENKNVNVEESKEKPKVGNFSKNAYELDEVSVYGDAIVLDRELLDQQGYDTVYDDSYSTDYVGKKRIEAYRGTTPSDLLSSFAGVYSGDARNSGAIDPNIRGIQAEGRIKTRIDGTEQAVTVYRGYNGSSNRNYVDPLLTSSIRIVKDSGLDTGVHTGIGGGIEIQTLGANDFIGEEGGFGGEIRVESSSNANKISPTESYDGYNLVDVPGYDPANYGWGAHAVNAYAQEHKQKTNGNQFNFANGNDYAGRVALGYKGKNWDVMGAVAKRKRGNYFSGKHNKSFYDQDNPNNNTGSFQYSKAVVNMAKHYKPGEDVLNTSSDTDSYLLKANWQPTDEHKLSASIRRSKSAYGEIMPTRAVEQHGKGSQWPLSHITADAYSLKYKYNPKDNKYVNLKTNLWMTDTESDLYNSGGSILRHKRGEPTVFDSAKNFVNHTRKGFDVSNRFTLNDKLNITTFASFQNENLNSRPNAWGAKSGDWSVYPRVGTRREYDLGFNTNWQVTDDLTLDVGAKYQSYKKHDEMLEKALNDPSNPDYRGFVNRAKSIESYEYEYNSKSAQDIADYKNSDFYKQQYNGVDDSNGSAWDDYCGPNAYPFMAPYCGQVVGGLSRADYIATKRQDSIDRIMDRWKGKKNIATWERGANGKFNRKDSPCLNGTIANTPGLVGAKDNPGKCILKNSGLSRTMSDPIDHVNKKDHSWVPAIAVNYQINDDVRVYARYNESVRFPSLFEGLTGSGGKDSPLGLKPEHSRKFEVGYVHNLTEVLPNAEVADVKLAYYQNNIENVIDRNKASFSMKNFDKKTVKGLELQGRFDNGDFFTDLGVNYTLKNKMCDEEFAALAEDERARGSHHENHTKLDCADTGHIGTYMASHAVPKLSAKLHIGARFLDRKLTVGGRITHSSAFDRSSYDDYMDNVGMDETRNIINPPYGWDKTFTVDAYARYKINNNFKLELSGNNLTDQYYLDPASRSTMPAPGRTFKLGFTGKF